MELNEFRNGDYVQTKRGMSKVQRDNDGILVADKTGHVFEVDDVTRVYLSKQQLRYIVKLSQLRKNVFVLDGLPGRFSFNATEMSFEWIINGQVIRQVDYLDELQGIYYYVTGNHLF